MYKYAVVWLGDCNLQQSEDLHRYLSYKIIDKVRQYIRKLQRRQKVNKQASHKELDTVTTTDTGNLLSDICKEDEVFIQRLLEGKPCLIKNKILTKYNLNPRPSQSN